MKIEIGTTARKLLVAGLLSAAFLAGAADARAGLSVVATTPDYGALARAVGGSEVKVKVLAKATEDPHFVDARPSHLVTLNRADVLIESGADLELGWLPSLVNGARNKKLLPGGPGRFLGSQGIGLLDIPRTLDRSLGDIHAKGNPHFLVDPVNAGIVATRLSELFCTLDAPNCPVFRRNLAAFRARLDERAAVWKAQLAPYAGKAIITYHNTWRYFARRYGLIADTFLEPKPGIPPSPPHLAKVIGKMKQEGLHVILVEPFQSAKTAAAVAERTGATVVEVCQFPGGLPGADDYIGMMDVNVAAITTALARTTR